ncbi:MAG: ABC transporter substrate-binding protein, partial [Gemmataceae bacterium]
NEAGGINGNTLKMIITDGKCEPREAALAAERLVTEDNVNVLLGGVASSATLAVKAVAVRNKVPMVAGVAGADVLTQKGNKYIFRVVPDISMYTEFGVNYLCNVMKVKRVAFVFQNMALGRETVDLSKPRLEACGATIVGSFPGSAQETNFQTTITDLKAERPDVTFLIRWPSSAIAFLRQAAEAGFHSTWFNIGSLSGPDFTAQAGKFAEGLIGVNVFEPSTNRPLAKRFAEAFVKRYHHQPDWFAAGFYTAVKVIANAIRRGGTTRAGIAEALAKTKNLPTILGPITFDDKGQASSLFTLFQYRNGQRKILRENVLVGQRYLPLK